MKKPSYFWSSELCTFKERILDKWADRNSLNIPPKSERGLADLTACCCWRITVLLFLWALPQKFAPSSSSAPTLACPALWGLYSVPCISRKLIILLAKLVFQWVTGLNHLTEGSEDKEITPSLRRSREGREKELGLGRKCNSEALLVGQLLVEVTISSPYSFALFRVKNKN